MYMYTHTHAHTHTHTHTCVSIYCCYMSLTKPRERQGLIPSVETLPEGLTMNTVLREAIDHIKGQHAQAKGEPAGVCVWCVCVRARGGGVHIHLYRWM